MSQLELSNSTFFDVLLAAERMEEGKDREKRKGVLNLRAHMSEL